MIAGILLAAGAARRFGARKLLHPLPDGTPIGLRSALNLVPAVDRALAVLAPEDRELAARLQAAGIEVCPCPASGEGMGASLACGVRAAADAAGWVIALADMPFVRPDSIVAVADALRAGAAIAIPGHEGERGHPIGFARAFHAELAALGGDVGARAIVARERARVVQVPVNDPGILRDIDTPDDLRR